MAGIDPASKIYGFHGSAKVVDALPGRTDLLPVSTQPSLYKRIWIACTGCSSDSQESNLAHRLWQAYVGDHTYIPNKL